MSSQSGRRYYDDQPLDLAKPEVQIPWREGETATIGKFNQINNFCISAHGNQKSCMSCHIGYDWQEDENVQDGNYGANLQSPKT